MLCRFAVRIEDSSTLKELCEVKAYVGHCVVVIFSCQAVPRSEGFFLKKIYIGISVSHQGEGFAKKLL